MSTFPSLTPNEDAYRAQRAEAEPTIAEHMARPGFIGVQARIVTAVCDAFNLAVVQESDRATDQEQIIHASVQAVVNVVMGIHDTTGIPKDILIGAINHKIAAIEQGRHTILATMRGEIIPVARG